MWSTTHQQGTHATELHDARSDRFKVVKSDQIASRRWTEIEMCEVDVHKYRATLYQLTRVGRQS